MVHDAAAADEEVEGLHELPFAKRLKELYDKVIHRENRPCVTQNLSP
jgi:hypothetical protein